tara:strand:+ start:410 stop:808 length:399 start_codon:yes stop_codon:yes gene_type:complete
MRGGFEETDEENEQHTTVQGKKWKGISKYELQTLEDAEEGQSSFGKKWSDPNGKRIIGPDEFWQPRDKKKVINHYKQAMAGIAPPEVIKHYKQAMSDIGPGLFRDEIEKQRKMSKALKDDRHSPADIATGLY